MPSDGDVRALGGAITLALCGSWDHQPPCPLAPHHTAAARDGEVVALRVLFAALPADEASVRAHIDTTLRTGQLTGPDGQVSAWTLLSSGPDVVADDERDHAGRLTLS